MPLLLWLIISCIGAPAWGQTSVTFYSEFRRVDEKGAIVRADRGGRVREILSPAFARNAWNTLRLVVHVPEGKRYALHIAQNPDDAVSYQLYRETPGGKTELATLPVQGVGGKHESFLLDCFVKADAPIRRIRLEAQAHDGESWIITPMEVRIQRASVPSGENHTSLVEYLCAGLPASEVSVGSGLMRRNSEQDAAMAMALEKRIGRNAAVERLLGQIGYTDRGTFCSAKQVESVYGPEWPSRMRDFLFREAAN